MWSAFGGFLAGLLKDLLFWITAEQLGEKRVKNANLEAANAKLKKDAEIDQQSKDDRRRGRAGLYDRLRQQYGITGKLHSPPAILDRTNGTSVGGKPSSSRGRDDDDDIF